MKLESLISTGIIREDVIVNVFDEELTCISKYDGKDSIDTKLNNREVDNIFPVGFGEINIILKEAATSLAIANWEEE